MPPKRVLLSVPSLKSSREIYQDLVTLLLLPVFHVLANHIRIHQFYYPTTRQAAVFLNTVVYLSGLSFSEIDTRNPNFVELAMPEHIHSLLESTHVISFFLVDVVGTTHPRI